MAWMASDSTTCASRGARGSVATSTPAPRSSCLQLCRPLGLDQWVLTGKRLSTSHNAGCGLRQNNIASFCRGPSALQGPFCSAGRRVKARSFTARVFASRATEAGSDMRREAFASVYRVRAEQHSPHRRRARSPALAAPRCCGSRAARRGRSCMRSSRCGAARRPSMA